MGRKLASYRFYQGLLGAIKRQIREVQGPESPDLKAYYRRYALQMERSKPERSSQSAFLKRASKARVILVGDFHTLDQAQKQCLALAEALLARKVRPVIALEMVLAQHDGHLRDYLHGRMDEQQFLDETGYFDHWGFDFNHYKPILELVRRERLAAHGINHEGALPKRDGFMAQRLLHLTREYPDQPVLALVGDLHLARAHLPKTLRSLGIEPVVLYQNSETVHMRALRAGVASEGWWSLGEDLFLVNNTAPWIKMQTYLTWLDHGGEALHSMYGFCRWADDDSEVDLTETVHQYIKILKDLFGLRLRSDDDFQVFTLQDLGFLDDAYFNKEPGKTYEKVIRDGNPLYLAWRNTIYIPILDVNRTTQEATHFLVGRNLNVDEGRAAFLDRIHYFASGFAASKLINPLRRTGIPEDPGQVAEEFKSLRRKKESGYYKRRRLACEASLDFLERLKDKREFPSSYIAGVCRLDRETCFDVSEVVGRYCGDRLYLLYDGGRLSGGDLKHYIFMQHNPFLYL